VTAHDTIQLAHGGGGHLSRILVEEEILPRFGEGPLAPLPDAALLPSVRGDLLFTTDGFVVKPLEFPGGDIGSLAVHGTVNDIAVSGGKPLWLSLSLILEEGLPLALLRRILDSVKEAAQRAEVAICTGDTKVVARGECDGLFITTAGLGARRDGFRLDRATLRAGDCILVSGSVGDHGMAVLAAREQLALTHGPLSDSAPVNRLVDALAPRAGQVRFMRDPTRGGLAAVLNELVHGQPVGLEVRESDIPMAAAARSVAELLGIDLLHAASEGRMVLACAPEAANSILAAWRALPEGAGAAIIGHVTTTAGKVVLRTLSGGGRLVDWPRGELLPRIC